jgi:hypothetical protein
LSIELRTPFAAKMLRAEEQYIDDDDDDDAIRY